ncbi:hypothetical protein [Streptomyces mirabilis]|uniref:hypothetical protein n=1 Tax=Streptomyces mirabilis TaxID=68239 RepID=UPI003697EB1E
MRFLAPTRSSKGLRPLSLFRFSYDSTTRRARVQWPKLGKHLINSELSQEEYVIRAERRRDLLWWQHPH